jgi:hypothetical protein
VDDTLPALPGSVVETAMMAVLAARTVVMAVPSASCTTELESALDATGAALELSAEARDDKDVAPLEEAPL